MIGLVNFLFSAAHNPKVQLELNLAKILEKMCVLGSVWQLCVSGLVPSVGEQSPSVFSGNILEPVMQNICARPSELALATVWVCMHPWSLTGDGNKSV